MGRSPAQVAINFITRRPAVTSTILGATTLGQLEDTLGSLAFTLQLRGERGQALTGPALFDFDRQVYGTLVRVEFLRKLRDEARVLS